MKNLTLRLCALVSVWTLSIQCPAGAQPDTSRPAEKEQPKVSLEQIEAQIDLLEGILLPPAGTALIDVVAVYGEAQRYDPGPMDNGRPTWRVQLLAPGSSDRRQVRLFMYVTEGKVDRDHLSCSFVSVNKPLYHPDSEGAKRQAELIWWEQEHTLVYLLKVLERYAIPLKEAKWNEKK